MGGAREERPTGMSLDPVSSLPQAPPLAICKALTPTVDTRSTGANAGVVSAAKVDSAADKSNAPSPRFHPTGDNKRGGEGRSRSEAEAARFASPCSRF